MADRQVKVTIVTDHLTDPAHRCPSALQAAQALRTGVASAAVPCPSCGIYRARNPFTGQCQNCGTFHK